jgi:hypothetical protein
MPSDITLELLVGMGWEPAPQQVMESLTQVQVSIAAKGKSGFDLSLAVSKSSPVLTDMLPSGYFDPPTRIIIAVNVGGTRLVLIDGVITAQEMVPSDEAGKSMLSIKGQDVSQMMELIDLSGLPFPCMPPEARVALILAKYLPLYGVVPLIIPSVLLDVPNPLDEVPAQAGTDLEYVESLAHTVGYTFFIQAGPLPGLNLAYWGPMLRTRIPFLPQPDPIAIGWDGRSNVESLQFGFDGTQKTLWLVLVQASTLSPIPIPIPVPDITPLSPPLGQKSPTPLKIAPMSGLAKYKPLQAAGIALGRAAEGANIVHGQGTLDVLRYGGILPARSIVEVRGAGITYDGEYFVESATHTIKPGSYKQSFTLTRNALIAGSDPFSNLVGYATSPAQSLSKFAPTGLPSISAVGPSGLSLSPGAKLPQDPTSTQGRTVALPASV